MPKSKLEDQFKKAEQLIRNAEHIVICGHERPDGDSLGSTLGLGRLIKENTPGKAALYCKDALPPSLAFLDKKGEIKQKIEWYPDLVIGLDYGSVRRLGLPDEVLLGAQVITFDHHPPDEQYGDVRIIDTSFSSTCELVYHFARSRKWKISPQASAYLLTGILTDTGSLSHNTSARTLSTAGALLANKAPLSALHKKTFSGRPARVMRAWGSMIGFIEHDKDVNFAYAFIPFEELQKYGIVMDDLTGLANVINNIAEANFALFAVEYERGKIKGSFRSDKFADVDVSRFAKELGGGGHKYAASFRAEGGIENVKSKVLEVIKGKVAAVSARSRAPGRLAKSYGHELKLLQLL